MRTIIYFLIVIGLFGMGVYNLIDNDGRPVKLPFDNGDSFAFGSSFFGDEAIPPVEEWKDILTGEWEFRNQVNNEKWYAVFEGTVTYSSNGKFVKYVTHKAYSRSGNKNYFTEGGSISGTWEINNDSTWMEKIQKCNISRNFAKNDKNNDFDSCTEYFPEKSRKYYGTKNQELSKLSLKKFNKNRIEIVSKNYTNGMNDTYKFFRDK